MPTKTEKDSVTGTETTGHEWDGIKELNTPLPKWWLYVLYATIAYSLVYWVLYPSIPGITGYFGGVLGTNNRIALDDKLATAEARQAVYLDRIAAQETAEIAGDQELLGFALAGGRSAFADNCAPCHGLGGAGQLGYPSLADDVWLWGGTLEEIETTLLYGIRSDHEDTHVSEMPAFGSDEILAKDEIAAVADYVLSLSGAAGNEAGNEAGKPAAAEAGEQAAAEAGAQVGAQVGAEVGAEIYADNCAACHGEGGEGDPSLGAPRLNDQIWLYGGTRGDIMAQVNKPQHGVMPAWTGRLDPATIKMLSVYVHSLGGGQ